MFIASAVYQQYNIAIFLIIFLVSNYTGIIIMFFSFIFSHTCVYVYVCLYIYVYSVPREFTSSKWQGK